MPKQNPRLAASNEPCDRTLASEPTTGVRTDTATQPGKVVHDPRGKAVYDLNVETGVFAGMNTIDVLGILNNPTLALDDESTLVPEWSGDPYNRR